MLKHVRVFSVEQAIAVDLKNVDVEGSVLYKNDEPVKVDGIGEVDLKDKTLQVVPVNLETATAMAEITRPVSRPRMSDEELADAETRLKRGESVKDVAAALGRSNGPINKLRKELGIGGQRGRAPMSAEKRSAIEQRLLAGDKVADISYDERTSTGAIYKIKNALETVVEEPTEA